jgi:ABC-type transport system involved in multi-copper enzyme maturation permease subunit
LAELIKANFLANLAYFRRSKLLIAFLLVFVLLTALEALPALFYLSSVPRLNVLREIFSSTNRYLLIYGGGLGLFIMSSHLRNRSLKMVFTKPCPPAVWLLSAFLTAAFISLLLTLFVLGSSVVMSLLWHLPVRPGLVFISLDTFVASLGLISYLMLLTTLAHPAIAIAFVLIFNADMFYGARFWALSQIKSGDKSLSLVVMERIFHALYMLVPMTHAFSEKTEGIYVSLRVMHGEWKYLPYSLAYVLVFSAFCYFVSLFVLQRRKHI